MGVMSSANFLARPIFGAADRFCAGIAIDGAPTTDDN